MAPPNESAPPPLAALPGIEAAAAPGSRPPPEASNAPPPLLEGIVRVKVPADKIAPFLARSPLFRGADKAVVTRVAAALQGLECAEGSELVVAGKVNDGFGILFSGRLQLLLPAPGGELVQFEALQPGDCFGETGALLGTESPYFAIAAEPSRVLWLPAAAAQSLVASVPAVGDALARRLAQRIGAVAAVERQAAPEVMTDIEAQLLQAVDAAHAAPAAAAATPELDRKPQQVVIPFTELRDFDLSPTVLQMVPLKMIRQFRLLPAKLSGTVLTVAMVNPRDTAALAELRRTLQAVDIVPVAISLDDFNHAITRLRLDDVKKPGAAAGPRINPDALQFETVADQDREGRDARAVGDDVIKLFNRIVAAALERDASDIHIEPTADVPRVRFRVNGVLQEWNEKIPPGTSTKGLAARIKVLAGLDITERRMPQDGRIGLTAGKRDVDLRVSTLPANRGEKIALRVLEAAGSTRSLDSIFFEPNVLAAARRALNKPYGGLLIAGPTGSGKTSTLYSLLNERKVTRPDTNIIMVEDPIEYRLPGVTQVQVNAGVGLGFAQVLRSMLRQDPDVIVVGEMRDEDTAQIGLEAAMTGHLLLASLHANNTMAAVQRLENLGCGRPLIAQAVQFVLVQRLVRRLCAACKKLDPPTPALLESLVARKIVDRNEQVLPRAVGCDACGGTGYAGRVVVLEALQVNDAVKEAIGSGKPLVEVQQIAREARALTSFLEYAKHLLQKQLVSGSEVLLSLAD